MSVIHRARSVYESLPLPVRSVVGRSARLLPVSIRYGRAFVDEQSQVRLASSSEDAAAGIAHERLQRVVGAALRTPYWTEVFADAGIDASSPVSFEDLARLPLLDKETVRARQADMIDPQAADGSRKYVTTGGTTGRSLGVWIDKDASPRDWAHVVEAWATVGYRLDDKRAVLRGVRLGQGSDRLITMQEPLRRELYVSVFDLDEAHMPAIIAEIERFSPSYLHGYPSAIEVLGRSLRCRSGTLPDLRGILAVSENLYPGQREYLESLFGVSVATFYGMSEKVAFAAECAAGHRYHVHEIYGRLDLVDEAGQVINEPGVRGEIVATGLLGTAMPLIRYRTGDYSSWISGVCACGKSGRTLGTIEGRWNREYLVTASGARVHLTALNLHSDVFDTVERYRFVQSRPGHVVLSVVPGAEYDQGAERRIMAEMMGKLEGLVELEIECTDALELTERGKALFIDQRIADDGGATS